MKRLNDTSTFFPNTQMNDDVSITALLHKYGALAFWDYAAAAPYVKIDMNPQVSIRMERIRIMHK